MTAVTVNCSLFWKPTLMDCAVRTLRMTTKPSPRPLCFPPPDTPQTESVQHPTVTHHVFHSQACCAVQDFPWASLGFAGGDTEPKAKTALERNNGVPVGPCYMFCRWGHLDLRVRRKSYPEWMGHTQTSRYNWCKRFHSMSATAWELGGMKVTYELAVSRY